MRDRSGEFGGQLKKLPPGTLAVMKSMLNKLCGCFVRRSIVLLHLAVTIPLASTLKDLVALWNEEVTVRV